MGRYAFGTNRGRFEILRLSAVVLELSPGVRVKALIPADRRVLLSRANTEY